MQRVRIGLTGLACVFLLVLLAAALFGLSGEDELAPGNQGGNAAANQLAEVPREPLAELGVAPGNPPEPATTNSVQPMPVPRGH